MLYKKVIALNENISTEYTGRNLLRSLVARTIVSLSLNEIFSRPESKNPTKYDIITESIKLGLGFIITVKLIQDISNTKLTKPNTNPNIKSKKLAFREMNNKQLILYSVVALATLYMAFRSQTEPTQTDTLRSGNRTYLRLSNYKEELENNAKNFYERSLYLILAIASLYKAAQIVQPSMRVGRQNDKNGDYYIGEFVNGKKHGIGMQFWANGNSYKGDFINNKITGKGTYLGADGTKYTGDFINAKLTGYGVFTFRDGATYTGKFKDNKMTGDGTFEPPAQTRLFTHNNALVLSDGEHHEEGMV